MTRAWVGPVVRRLWPQAPRVALGLAAGLVTAALGLLEPWPLKVLVDSVFGPVPTPAILGPAADLAGGGTRGLVTTLGLALLLLVVLGRLAEQAGTYLLSRVGASLVADLRRDLFAHLHGLPLRRLERDPVGDLGYRLSVDAYAIQTLFNEGLVNVTTAGLTLAGMAAVMARLDLPLTLAALAVAPPLWWAFRRFGPGMEGRALRFDEQEGRLSAAAHESLGAARLVRALDRASHETARFGAQAGAALLANLALRRGEAVYLAGTGVVMAAGAAAVLWVGAWRVLAGAITVGQLLVFLAYVAMLYGPLANLTSVTTNLREAAPRLRRVLELLAEPAEEDPGAAEPQAGRARGEIVFQAVAFGYEPGRLVLRDVTFRVAPGEILGVVGATGAGKSTLLHLVLRFEEPTAGRILLDGRDIRTLPRSALRRQISLVAQEAVLFSASVGENIRYAWPQADPGAVVLAAKAAGAHDFIQSLPEGYDTLVGERGVRLSAGQRQAIALARAFLRPAPVLLLDEPTTGLDAEAEAAFLAALAQAAEGRAVLLVSHRASTLRAATHILVLQEGRIGETGTPAELLARRGTFRRLFELQQAAGPGPAAAAGERDGG